MDSYGEKNLKVIFALFFFLVFSGTVGFVYFRDLSPWVAFYETLHLMLSHFYDTNGEKEEFLLQLTNLMLISGSLIIVVYVFKWFGDYFFGGQLKENLKKKKMESNILKLEDHFIVCGYGRVGRQVAEELHNEGVPFIVVDRSKPDIQEAEKKGYLFIEGDSTDEGVLLKTNIKKAQGLVSALGTDSENLFVTLAARSDNEDLFIVARASREESVSKLEKAGADRVALPYQIGGYHMATMVMKPAVVDFLDVLVDGKHDELQVEEIVVPADSQLCGKTLGRALSRRKTGSTILAINKANGESKVNPSGEEVLQANDKLIILGTKDKLEKISDAVISETEKV